MKSKHTVLLAAAILAFSSAVLLRAAPAVGGHGLYVDITSPADGSHQPWNSQVAYAVTATYNGRSSKFGELPANDLVLRATYVVDATKVAHPAGLPEGIVQISQSNCMGCHDFAASSSGPSFSAIGKRYEGKANSADLLAAHIRGGSGGAWGGDLMPPHPDLSPAQAAAIAKWIVAYSNDPSVHYAVGKSGSVPMSAVGKPGPKAGILLTAFYTGPLKPGDTRSATGRTFVVVRGSGS